MTPELCAEIKHEDAHTQTQTGNNAKSAHAVIRTRITSMEARMRTAALRAPEFHRLLLQLFYCKMMLGLACLLS